MAKKMIIEVIESSFHHAHPSFVMTFVDEGGVVVSQVGAPVVRLLSPALVTPEIIVRSCRC